MSRPVTLHRVTLRLPPDLPAAERGSWERRAASALDNADLRPRGLPPGAILIVRRLADPAPGLLWQGAPWQAGQRWGEHARGAVERHWSHAARPAREPVPPNAQAVWFADAGEWLACLSVDMALGLAPWWWAAWLRRPVPYRQATLWRDEARWLPAALAYLHTETTISVAALVARLEDHALASVCDALIRAHSLPDTCRDLTITPAQAAELIPGRALEPAPPAAARLATLALVVNDAPQRVRAIARQRAATWRLAAAPAFRADTPLPRAAEAPTRRAAAPLPRIEPPDLPLLHAHHGPALSEEARPAAAPAAGPAALTAVEAREASAPAWAPPPNTAGHGGAATAPGALRPGPHPADWPGLQDRAVMVLPPDGGASVPDHSEVITELGGVFYLLNPLIALDWLDEADHAPVHPWLRLEALARLLLGEAAPDPLWDTLAELARAGDNGTDVRQMADGWRTRQWPTLQAWLMPRLVAGADLAALLRGRARLRRSRTHIDIHFRLEQIDLIVRRAGLDRDPGWVPYLQRVVTFHFDA